MRHSDIFCAFNALLEPLPWLPSAIVFGLQTFAQGVIAIHALHGAQTLGLRTAIRGTVACLPMLLLGNAVSGGLMVLAAIGLTLPFISIESQPRPIVD